METIQINSPVAGAHQTASETTVNSYDGLTYTQLLDHGYGLTPITPITPSNSKETLMVTPGRTHVSFFGLLLVLNNLIVGHRTHSPTD